MDVQTTCLGVLAMGPASGYEIRKEFEDGPFSHFAEGGFGSIYPALGRLTDLGLVTYQHEAQEKRPDKKIYQITENGYEVLFRTLASTDPGDDKYKSDFLFILFFAERMPPQHIERVVDARIAWYREKLLHIGAKQCEREGHVPSPLVHEAASQQHGYDLVRGYGIAVYQAALVYLVENRDALIALARSGSKAKAQSAQDKVQDKVQDKDDAEAA